MKFGVVGSFGSTAQVLEMAETAEAAGWDGFFTWDGISIGEVDTFDPWALLGALTQRTSRMVLGAMVFPLARRRPWKVAREAITVDHLSGGRLVLPVALGAANDDGGFARVSGEATTRRERAERLDETLEILEQAWTGETVSYRGKHYTAEDLVFRPRPVQQPRIPIWVVGVHPVERSLRRAARWDGIMPVAQGAGMEPTRPETVAAVRDWMAEHRESDTPFDIVVEGQLPDDDPDAARARLQALADAGATWWIESRWEGEAAQPAGLLEMIRRGPLRS
ncbi:LLM class flavin-dependent oxidoreductase [Nakamurella sp. YIM 132087]|uniref:LLM class flavin-dependent oxidoreductase n=1 Tax=Nakamurella alba TaxID=2665158 RepID=A0A7K1FT96_9ACTN|nr:LLM class flavin-dependent oxidoreductase [Nakamurella alba]MTD17377.1 LLM class flavin-dependent oxidoreductase [Nakamurella alba]